MDLWPLTVAARTDEKLVNGVRVHSYVPDKPCGGYRSLKYSPLCQFCIIGRADKSRYFVTVTKFRHLVSISLLPENYGLHISR